MLSPIQEHETWHIHDATKIQEFMTCPRMYFYHYVLGWTKDKANVHLIVGDAWHHAMATLLREGYSSQAIIKAIAAYHRIYEPHAESFIGEDSPKVNADIPLALTAYCENWKHDDFPGTKVVKYTEVSGQVLINDARTIHFRLDALLEDAKARVLEHKTASRFDRVWEDQWLLSFQVFTYLHVLYCIYKESEVDGVVVNGTAFLRKKNEFEFLRLPIRKDMTMLEAWLYEANHWLDLIEMHFRLLEKQSPSAVAMECFPKNTTSCTKYMGCPYLGMCSVWSNPCGRVHAIPPGYKVEYWNPTDTTTKPARFVMTVAQGEAIVEEVKELDSGTPTV